MGAGEKSSGLGEVPNEGCGPGNAAGGWRGSRGQRGRAGAAGVSAGRAGWGRRGRLGPLDAGGLAVLVEVGLKREALVALAAAIVLEGRVRLHVRAQVGAVGEGLAAMRAAERLLAGVRAHVALQQPGPREGLAAHAALVAQVVRKHVHSQRGHGHIRLAACRALARQLAVQAAVRLLVAAQVRRRGVRLAAFGAGVPVPASRRRPRAPRTSPSAPGVPRALRVATAPSASPPRAPVRDEEGVHGVTVGHGRLPAKVAS